ncbi:MAG TPA: response regulator transcription factor [Candidatus Dormibacteraeota bacterium]|nr:response regulator transcription factor [Candidatus Dormibacteraeota bacterium]
MDILVVDDDPALRAALDRALKLEGYRVALAHDGRQALQMMTGGNQDAVILDLGLPLMDGVEVCRRVRERGDRTPVLMLTARDAVTDRVEGLDAGADDYLVKPFALDELLARLRALLRRTVAAPSEDVLKFSDVILELQTMEVRRGQRELQLTRTEFRLLELFMRNPRVVLTRSRIFEEVWGYDFGASSNALEVYVSYLRRKLEAESEPRLIHTVRGVGYTLR